MSASPHPHRRHIVAAALLAGALSVGALLVGHGSHPATATPGPARTCLARGPLPDAACTPGVTDPRVTQATIATTICVAGYTATVRPSSAYTTALKRSQMVEYGWQGTPADFEEDHLIPLELGGSPTDPRNLWPEPWSGAHRKDQVENAANRAVCSGVLALADAQQAIATDWTAIK